MRSRWFIWTCCAVAVATEASSESTGADGRALFVENCAACHGIEGNGDGPEAVGLATRPADLTRIAARRDGVWPMLEVMAIVDGYTGLTNPRENMPAIEGIVEGPMVDFDSGNGLTTPVPARLVSIVEYLESIQSPRPKSYVP
jgi:mono/diheme cytochrome c family protein